MTSLNIETSLLKNKISRRKPGAVPYPAAHSKCLSNFDIWDNMFFGTCYQSLTMHQFEEPPATVLDLGCGTGFWTIKAAEQWTNSVITGYDFRDIQPKPLHKLRPDICQRVKWVHGNLLDGLDFPCSHFDFVRIAGIGLGVPEDEWQSVFEEVARVMKPGAVIEIIEEDPIFPCAEPPQLIRTKPQLLPIVDCDPSSSSTYFNKSSATLTTDQWSATLNERFDPHPSKSTYSLNSLASHSPPNSIASASNSVSDDDSVSKADMMKILDHSNLKAAWEAMLNDRFLATGLLSVLPFYLSVSFVGVQARPPLKVPLPPNSYDAASLTQKRSTDSGFSEWTKSDSVCDVKLCHSTRSALSDGSSTILGEQNHLFNSSWATMHLAKTVKMVSACKEAIWEEYKKLYSTKSTPITRTSRPDNIKAQISEPSSREDFESDWRGWEIDMADRIGMRNTMLSQFAWSEPHGEGPSWRAILDKAQASRDIFSSGSSITSSESQSSVPLCRSLGGFVGWKPLTHSPT